jgi:hypothetical protein
VHAAEGLSFLDEEAREVACIGVVVEVGGVNESFSLYPVKNSSGPIQLDLPVLA